MTDEGQQERVNASEGTGTNEEGDYERGREGTNEG